MADVACMDHLWDSQKNCTEDGSLDGSSKKHQETCTIACFWGSHGSLTVLGSPVGPFVGLKDPGQNIQILKEDDKLKVKRDGPINHHFGADYSRDKDKTLVCQPKKYIDRLLESYQSMFKQDPPRNM